MTEAEEATAGRGGAEGAEEAGHAKEGLLEFAVGGVAGDGGRAGFVVGEDGADDGGEVAADTGAVIAEFFGDAVDVGGAGVAGDEALNQEMEDEGAGVLVGEEGVEGELEILAPPCAAGIGVAVTGVRFLRYRRGTRGRAASGCSSWRPRSGSCLGWWRGRPSR